MDKLFFFDSFYPFSQEEFLWKYGIWASEVRWFFKVTSDQNEVNVVSYMSYWNTLLEQYGEYTK